MQFRSELAKKEVKVFNYDEVFWLNVTNVVLGLVTLMCLIAIGFVVLKEIRERARAKATELAMNDDHAFVIDGLGVTMADGGEKIRGDEMLVVTEDGIENTAGAGEEKKKERGRE